MDPVKGRAGKQHAARARSCDGTSGVAANDRALPQELPLSLGSRDIRPGYRTFQASGGRCAGELANASIAGGLAR